MKDIKRKKIIDAAISLFSRTHDFRRVSLEAISAEADVSPATIYNNFGNRETLVNEVIKTLVSANMDSTRTLVHSKLSFPQKLVGIINGKLNMGGEVNEIIEKLVSQDKTIAPFIDKIYEKEIKPLWKELIAEGKEQGYINPSLNFEVLLVFLDALQAGFKARPELLKSIKDNISIVQQLAHLMYYGFLIKEIDFFSGGKNRETT